MRRIMWVGVALLVMVAILGYGLYTLRSIKEANRRSREKNAGKQEAITIIATEAPTSVWDKLHAENESETPAEGGQDTAPQNSESVQEREGFVEVQPQNADSVQAQPATAPVSIVIE